jgi:hypothetical protein
VRMNAKRLGWNAKEAAAAGSLFCCVVWRAYFLPVGAPVARTVGFASFGRSRMVGRVRLARTMAPLCWSRSRETVAVERTASLALNSMRMFEQH